MLHAPCDAIIAILIVVRRGRSRLTTPIYGTVVAWRWYGRAMRFEPTTIIRWYIIAVISWIPMAEHLDRRHRGILVTPLPALPDHLLATPPILQPIPPYYTGPAWAYNYDHVYLPRDRCWLDRSSNATADSPILHADAFSNNFLS